MADCCSWISWICTCWERRFGQVRAVLQTEVIVSRTPTTLERALVEQLLNELVFFDTGSDDELDPDLAVRQMEGIGATLQTLGPDDRATFAAIAEELIAAADPQPRPSVIGRVELRVALDRLLLDDDPDS